MVSSWLLTLIVAAGAGVALWLISFIIEALRPSPDTPAALRWAPGIPIDYVDVRGAKLRFVKVGTGPVIVLLHTLRTQLDLFERMIPDLSKRFTIYAVDYPGHGYSGIPQARYDAAFFANAVEGFLDELDLRDVTLAGVSIGGAVPLIVAARHNPRVSRVIDVKTPDSNEASRNRIENFAHLSPRDQLKFVICSRADYDWSKNFLQAHGLTQRCGILFSPSYNQQSPTLLADWILADRLAVRFQMQLHKILWGDVPGK